MDCELFYQGQERGVYVYGSVKPFRKWMEGMDRPPQKVMLRAIDWIGHRPLPDLISNQRKLIPVQGSNPKLYELRKDRARLHCCMKDGNIFILDWVQRNNRERREMFW